MTSAMQLEVRKEKEEVGARHAAAATGAEPAAKSKNGSQGGSVTKGEEIRRKEAKAMRDRSRENFAGGRFNQGGLAGSVRFRYHIE